MNRRFPESPEGLPERLLKSVRDVTELLAETINHLHAGKLDPRVANAVVAVRQPIARRLPHWRIL